MTYKKLILIISLLIIISNFTSAYDSDTKNLANSNNVLFVDMNNPTCSDYNSRNNALNGDTPWCTLKIAMEKVESGDIVYVKQGTYNDWNYLRDKSFSQKTIFTSYPGEDVILTHVYADFLNTPNYQWNDIGTSDKNIWVTRVNNFDIYDFTVITDNNGEMFYIYNNYADFNQNKQINAIWADEINNKIYIKFEDQNANPRNIPLHVSHNEYGVIRIENVKGAEVVISNFTIQYGGWQVYIRNSVGVTIKDNTINGGLRGIYGVHHTGEEISNIKIQNNLITGYFDPEWSWNEIKTNIASRHESSGIHLINVNENIIIDNNKVHTWFNGIFLDSNLIRNKNAKILNNEIWNIFDDGLEIEDLQENARVHDNTIYDAFVGLSLAYGDCTGSCYFFNNIVVSNKEIKWTDTENMYGECFKIGRTGGKTKNWNIHHNTCYAKRYGLVSLLNDASENTKWTDNIFYSESNYLITRSGLASNGIFYNNNLYYRADYGRIFRYWNHDTDSTTYANLATALASNNWDGTWDTNSVNTNPRFTDANNLNFQPIKDSPACEMSTTGSYVGAIPCEEDILPYCGDNLCNSDESCYTCQTDCGTCPNRYIWFESESGDLTSPMEIVYDLRASYREYIQVENEAGYNGAAVYDINLNIPDEYILWGRVLAPNVTDDSFKIQLDNNEEFIWDISIDTYWTWQQVSARDGDNPIIFTLLNSNHEFTLKQREDGTKIDMFLLTNDLDYVPTGTGNNNNIYCGDTYCNWNEDCNNCNEDCGACPLFCGDGTCNEDENCNSCSDDCGECETYCGDNTCDSDENCNLCAQDCGECPSFCGDFNCDNDETCDSCSQDCGTCQSFCGDNTCDNDEDCNTCNQDCGTCPSFCGDNTCDNDEDCNSCQQDCGECPSFCGDNMCDNDEDCTSCNIDCGICPSFCGDFTCNTNEDCNTCSYDCGECVPFCGDQICNNDETCSNCEADCNACPLNEEHWLETEIPTTLTAPMTIITDSTASNNQFISVPNLEGYNGEATYTININEVGFYIIWGRVKGPNGMDNSFLIKFDNEEVKLWDIEENNVWNWDLVSNRHGNNPERFYLTKGVHTIYIQQREDGSQIDKFLLTNDFEYVPSGLGQTGENNLNCGDGFCNDGETCSNCETDCNRCQNICGDTYCDSDESCSTCNSDCGECEEEKPKTSSGGRSSRSSRQTITQKTEIIPEEIIENITKEIQQESPKEIIEEEKENQIAIDQIINNESITSKNNLTTNNIIPIEKNELKNKITGFAISDPVKFSIISFFSLIILFIIIASVSIFIFYEIDFAEKLRDSTIFAHTKLSQIYGFSKEKISPYFKITLSNEKFFTQTNNFQDDPYFELKKWVFLAKNNGFNDPYIKRILMAQGWTNEIIDRILVKKI
jgi:hypothetical protein